MIALYFSCAKRALAQKSHGWFASLTIYRWNHRVIPSTEWGYLSHELTWACGCTFSVWHLSFQLMYSFWEIDHGYFDRFDLIIVDDQRKKNIKMKKKVKKDPNRFCDYFDFIYFRSSKPRDNRCNIQQQLQSPSRTTRSFRVTKKSERRVAARWHLSSWSRSLQPWTTRQLPTSTTRSLKLSGASRRSQFTRQTSSGPSPGRGRARSGLPPRRRKRTSLLTCPWATSSGRSTQLACLVLVLGRTSQGREGRALGRKDSSLKIKIEIVIALLSVQIFHQSLALLLHQIIS